MAAVVLTSNLRLVDAPGNVLMPAKVTGLVDRQFLTEKSVGFEDGR